MCIYIYIHIVIMKEIEYVNGCPEKIDKLFVTIFCLSDLHVVTFGGLYTNTIYAICNTKCHLEMVRELFKYNIYI